MERFSKYRSSSTDHKANPATSKAKRYRSSSMQTRPPGNLRCNLSERSLAGTWPSPHPRESQVILVKVGGGLMWPASSSQPQRIQDNMRVCFILEKFYKNYKIWEKGNSLLCAVKFVTKKFRGHSKVPPHLCQNKISNTWSEGDKGTMAGKGSIVHFICITKEWHK